jgi:hypothetical protein
VFSLWRILLCSQISKDISKNSRVCDLQRLFWIVKMICHKCGKVVLWERIIVDKGTEKRVYHIQCWDRDEEK